MIIVAGTLTVDPDERARYLEGCLEVIRAAREAPGCHDFSLAADLLDPSRINVFEKWESREQLAAFRRGGPSGEQRADLLSIDVTEFEIER